MIQKTLTIEAASDEVFNQIAGSIAMMPNVVSIKKDSISGSAKKVVKAKKVEQPNLFDNTVSQNPSKRKVRAKQQKCPHKKRVRLVLNAAKTLTTLGDGTFNYDDIATQLRNFGTPLSAHHVRIGASSLVDSGVFTRTQYNRTRLSDLP